MASEVERKYLVPAVPNTVQAWTATEVRQGYLAIQEDSTEVRIRDREGTYWLTVKRGKGLERQEEEVRLTAEQFEALWPLTDGRRVQKTRYAGTVEGQPVEVDIYRGALRGLVIAEVEFPSVSVGIAFEPPSWFGEEVTDEDRFKNQQLATLGSPTTDASN